MPTTKPSAKGGVTEMIAQVVGMVGSAIITKSYEKKNAKFQAQIESELAKLTDLQRQEIYTNMSKIADSNQRLAVLINYLSDTLGTASANSLKSNIDANLLGSVKKDTKAIYWFVGISAIVLIGIVVIKKITK